MIDRSTPDEPTVAVAVTVASDGWEGVLLATGALTAAEVLLAVGGAPTVGVPSSAIVV
ncbi:hypothetical protein [Dictyobacter formicarum]|uniref:Uncharacterized protein n=1 Tax=Dictyobacter formicarum TaxID=2778368 RepID=A0ABQ3VJ25_9CHLR|nr:hypothetical protein [Dictyobacter formicarum]GHO85613.1 hypothetical protein KSZ_36190 [Dictyobacter formicarum]